MDPSAEISCSQKHLPQGAFANVPVCNSSLTETQGACNVRFNMDHNWMHIAVGPRTPEHVLLASPKDASNDSIPFTHILLNDIKHVLLTSLLHGIQCIAAIQVNHQVCSGGISRLAPHLGIIIGHSLYSVFISETTRHPHAQLNTHLRRMISIHQQRRRMKRKRGLQTLLKRVYCLRLLISTLPGHELACIIILFSAILIGIISLTYPLLCYVTIMVVYLLASITKTSAFSRCWHIITGLYTRQSEEIAWLAESLMWSFSMSRSKDLVSPVIFLAMLNASSLNPLRTSCTCSQDECWWRI